MVKVKKIKIAAVLLAVVICVFPCVKSKAYADGYEYYLGGFSVGFDLSSDNGALVVGLAEVIGKEGIFVPAKDAGIKNGDYILSLNGKKICTAKDIDQVLNECRGGGIIAEILSDNEKIIRTVTPRKDLSGKYKLGVLIRDYLSGLGTVTLINQKGEFCSLGHPVADEEGALLGIGGGLVYKCFINGIVKGERGKAGELKGTVVRTDVLGEVYSNTKAGLIGVFTDKSVYSHAIKAEIGVPQAGAAQIYTTVSGNTPVMYSAAIVKVDAVDKANKNIVIKITDAELIKLAGGIVQGMSGSPIIQNGKIVGAVTHVFLNDSTRGFGISAEKLLEISDLK